MTSNTNTQQQGGSKIVTYLDPSSIENNFTKQKKLGTGGDGIVMLYKHTFSETCIAVKFPRVDKERESLENAIEDLDRRQRELMKELSVMRGLGKHPAIVQMLGWDNAWKPHAPAIFYEYCPLEDVVTYFRNLIRSLEFIPEHTLWKLFTDMTKALDFIHNCQEIPILHCDIKPDNILVVDGPLLRFDNKITSLLIFKLVDFSRSKEYRPQFAKYEDGSKCYWGTWSYAPPWEEQYRYQTPAADIWSLGATLRFFATGKEPVMATTEFIQYMKVEGLFNQNLMPYYQGAGRRPFDEVVRALAHCLSTFDEYRVQSRVEQMVFNVPGEGSFKANHIEKAGRMVCSSGGTPDQGPYSKVRAPLHVNDYSE